MTDILMSSFVPQVLSRGRLVKYGRYQIHQRLMVSMMVSITKEMLPSFLLVVYYHTNDREVVSDSLWVDVKASCAGPVRQHKTEVAQFKFTIFLSTPRQKLAQPMPTFPTVGQRKENKGNI